MLSKKDYEWAYMADGAVNLSGLAHSLAQVCVKIRDDARERGVSISTEEVNHHPIVRMYAQAIFSLAGCYDFEAMVNASFECKEKGELYPFVVQQ